MPNTICDSIVFGIDIRSLIDVVPSLFATWYAMHPIKKYFTIFFEYSIYDAD